MRVLVTGATGFLGSHLVKSLITEGHQVIIVKRSFSDTWRIVDVLPHVVSYDLDKCDLKQPFVEAGIDVVIHTATCYGRKNEPIISIFESNIVFPLKLLDTASLFRKVVFINTDTFFNTKKIFKIPFQSYSLSKHQFYEWGKYYGESDKIRFINLKLEHMYGPGDSKTKFIIWIIRELLNGRNAIDLTKGEQKRDFIYIDDAVGAFLAVLNHLDSFKERFLEFEVGSGKSYTIKEVVELLKRIIASKSELNFGALPYRKNEIMESKANISRLLKLSWKPVTPLLKGLLSTIKFEKENLGKR